MTKFELNRLDGQAVNVVISDKSAEGKVGISVITREFTISRAKIVTESESELYAEKLQNCAAVLSGRLEGEPGIIGFVRLDELNLLKLRNTLNEMLGTEYVLQETAAGARA